MRQLVGLLAVLGASNAGAQTAAAVRGVLVQRDSRTPVDGARIAVVGTPLTTTTDVQGRFELPGIPAGIHLLQARAVGFVVGTWLIQLNDGQSLRDTLELEALAVALTAVTVVANASDWRSEAAFERRRNSGVGVFMTREEIRQRHPASVSDLMRSVPGVLTNCRGRGGCIVLMTRSTRPCQPEYFLDGYPATLSTGSSFPIDLAAIRGVEVYRNQSETPAEFQRPGLRCGVIAIWTIEPGTSLERR